MVKITDRKQFDDFYNITADILTSQHFQSLKSEPHHGNSSGRFEHCLSVAYYSFVISKKLGLDFKSAARGGLLHDYFFDNWREVKNAGKGLDRIRQCHGMAHPRKALKNARTDYELNDREENMILRHMFPLTITPPKYGESWIVSLVDKGVAIGELARAHTPRKIALRRRLASAVTM